MLSTDFSNIFPGELSDGKQFKNPLMIDEEDFIGPENLKELTELNVLELETLFQELEYDDQRNSMKLNYVSISDATEISKLENETPLKMISQPIPLLAKKDSSSQSSSKRKQNLHSNVTRNENAEFIDNADDLQDSKARRQLFSSSSSYFYPLQAIQVVLPENTKRTVPSAPRKRAKSKKSFKIKLEGDKHAIAVGALNENGKSVLNSASQTTPTNIPIPIPYSESKRGLRKIICQCKKTFRSEQSYISHLESHSK